MQCSQPIGFTGVPINFRPTYPYTYALPQIPRIPQTLLYPQIVGDGEVASVLYPDGSIHLYFIPSNQRISPYDFNHNNNPCCNEPTGVYYVKCISNPISPTVFHQQCQKMYTGAYTRPFYNSDCNLNPPTPGFQLKFHNDSWTSTTDLHYFFPCLRSREWFPLTQSKGCVAIQVDIPDKESAVQQEICAKPCLCFQSDEKEISENDLNSDQSKKRYKKKDKRQKKSRRKSDVLCRCRQDVDNIDKSIATVTDQCNSCVGASERITQTAKSANSRAAYKKSNVKTELWLPKTSHAGRGMQKKPSNKKISIHDTCSSSTCCCSD